LSSVCQGARLPEREGGRKLEDLNTAAWFPLSADTLIRGGTFLGNPQ
jgi:hypothetical protein